MARLPRLGIPSIPQHVIQRGNNRQACFYADDDHRFYLECLGEAARKYRVSCAGSAEIGILACHFELVARGSGNQLLRGKDPLGPSTA